jgi:hypothetical protein
VEGDALGVATATSIAVLAALDVAVLAALDEALAVTANGATSRAPARSSVASR